MLCTYIHQSYESAHQFQFFGSLMSQTAHSVFSPPEIHCSPSSLLRLSFQNARLPNCHKLFNVFNGLINPFLTLLHPPVIAKVNNFLTAKNGRNTGSSPLPFILSYSNANVLAA
mmetsp:Transcript_4983/g.8517  ORF Transcript_4983/g.8517 Transcript_4983/m.8517 type:complete len:114 (-) Transcript_4983:843-1184(-)